MIGVRVWVDPSTEAAAAGTLPGAPASTPGAKHVQMGIAPEVRVHENDTDPEVRPVACSTNVRTPLGGCGGKDGRSGFSDSGLCALVPYDKGQIGTVEQPTDTEEPG